MKRCSCYFSSYLFLCNQWKRYCQVFFIKISASSSQKSHMLKLAKIKKNQKKCYYFLKCWEKWPFVKLHNYMKLQEVIKMTQFAVIRLIMVHNKKNLLGVLVLASRVNRSQNSSAKISHPHRIAKYMPD
jgi:hypothetical protein